MGTLRKQDMAENSKIEWTDHTFNPWIGCTKVSPACKNCYAERDMNHRFGKVDWGPSGTRVKTSEENWKKPFAWNKKAGEQNTRYRVFCASLADVFEDWNGLILDHNGNKLNISMNGLRLRLMQLIASTPNLDWLLLTKRPENIQKFFVYEWARTDMSSSIQFRNNIWLGTSVESQYQLDRIETLKLNRSFVPVLFISAEPLLGPIPNLEQHLEGIDWVIAGGESGPNARPSSIDWFRDIRNQCQKRNVAFLFKQWGEYDHNQKRIGKVAAGRLLDGVTHDELPASATATSKT